MPDFGDSESCRGVAAGAGSPGAIPFQVVVRII
jgi:hypothetical protein